MHIIVYDRFVIYFNRLFNIFFSYSLMIENVAFL